MTKKTELATRDENAGALAIPDYGELAADGVEEVGLCSGPPPFLRVLQTTSDQTKKAKDKYISGAEPGMFILTGSNTLIDGAEGIHMVLIGVKECFVERTPYPDYKTVGMFDPTSEFAVETVAANRKRTGKKFVPKMVTAEGNDFVETYLLFALILDGPGGNAIDAAIFPIQSTKITPYREQVDKPLKTFAKNDGAPIYAHQLHVTTKFETRPAGDSFNVVFEPALGEAGEDMRARRIRSLITRDNPLFETIVALREQFKTGDIEVNFGANDEAEDTADSGAAKGVF